MGLLKSKFRQFLTELSARDTSVFSFPDDILRKCQWIFTKLCVCIDIVETWFEIADGKFRQYLTELSARSTSVFYFKDNNLSKPQ